MKKIIAAIFAATIAVSALSLVASAYAMPFMHWNYFPNTEPTRQKFGMFFPSNPNRTSLNVSFVSLYGFVSQFGTANANGTIVAQVRTLVNGTEIRQGYSAAVMWTTNSSRPVNAVKARENFTYTFYAARLVNASMASVTVNDYTFFLNGNWNVYNVTSTFTITTDSAGNVVGFNCNQNAVVLATNAYGELTVPSSGGSFTLAITGVNTLTGSVVVQRITTKMFNPFIIGSANSMTVTPSDVASVASAYGSMPGYGNYDQRMDYNFNYRIDITDLATAAANLNQ